METATTTHGMQIPTASLDHSPLCASLFASSDHKNESDSAPSSTNTTPFIKRKCLHKDDAAIQLTQQLSSRLDAAATTAASSSSPYLISCVNLTSADTSQHSPKLHLNDSFETLQLTASASSSSSSVTSKSGQRNGRYLSRRLSHNAKLFSKHKSAPLANMSYAALMNEAAHMASISEAHHPLNDISNHLSTKHMASLSSSSGVNALGAKLGEDMSFGEDQRDEFADLENLLFGSNAGASGGGGAMFACKSVSTSSGAMSSTATSSGSSDVNMNADHQSFIKQSLEIDATHQNLIGDRTRQHILPVIQSTKHQDLHCISPETVSCSHTCYREYRAK